MLGRENGQKKAKTPSRLTNWREDAFGKERKVI